MIHAANLVIVTSDTHLNSYRLPHNSDASSALGLFDRADRGSRETRKGVCLPPGMRGIIRATHTHTHTHTHDHIYHPHVTGRELNPYYLVAAYDRLIINRSVVRTPTLSPSIHPPDNYNTALIKETFNRQACRR